MNYREVLELFAESEIGAIVVAKNNIILDINSAASRRSAGKIPRK